MPADSSGNDDDRTKELRRQRAAAFVVRFDRGEFWLAHEELEELWREERADAYKGLIQIAAGCLHMERGNGRGAERMFRTAVGYLDEYPELFRGFDLQGIRAHGRRLRRLADELAAGNPPAPGTIPGFRMTDHYGGEVDPDAVEDVELPYRARRHRGGGQQDGRGG